jgi:toxin-antitoxin system PIN domain toxin
MTAGLPDVNVLLALMWPQHIGHLAARAWLRGHAATGWATTPITESGFVRLSCDRAVVQAPTDPPGALAALAQLTAVGSHRFVADEVVGVLAPQLVSHVRGYRHVTDAHLLSICAQAGLTMVTFDRGMTSLAPRNSALIHVLDT